MLEPVRQKAAPMLKLPAKKFEGSGSAPGCLLEEFSTQKAKLKLEL